MGDRRGITLLELVVVLAVGGILAGIAVNTFGALQARTAARSAESNFLSLHAQARASAVERGTLARLVVEENSVSVIVGTGSDAETIRTLDFMNAFDVEIDIPSSSLELCMSPRGIGDLACTSFSSGVDVTFTRGGESRSVHLLPLGQAVR